MKLNLGCGDNILNGYINVDYVGNPDVICNLQRIPWPWEDNSVDEIVLRHVLEHLGKTPATFIQIMKEIYRICKDNALLKISFPHHQHDDFYTDPEHKMPLTVATFELFSKKKNIENQKAGFGNSRLALLNDVDFEIETATAVLDDWFAKYAEEKNLSQEEMEIYARAWNNVIKEIQMKARVRKE